MSTPNAETHVLPPRFAGWERFWFTPADPTLLGLIRIFTGLIVTYTVAVYGLSLQAMMGEEGWYDLKLRNEVVRERPMQAAPLSGPTAARPVPPKNEEEREYYERFRDETNGAEPLPPYPRTPFEVNATLDYFKRFNGDLRLFGLAPPKNKDELAYLWRYTERWNQPPPAYPKSKEEEKWVDEYMEREGGVDPRSVYALGYPAWSVWFDVTEPFWMNVVHWGFVVILLAFTLGLCTRVTAPLAWIIGMCYIQRNPVVLFGVDTMTNILLLYLAIGPSGAALSLDRLVARWWSKARPDVLSRWFRFWGKEVSPAEIAAGHYSPRPEPSVTANVAVRLLQVHVCIIYLMAGLSKLQGAAWWNGQAIWGTIANYEFAPMQFQVYNDLLRQLCRNQLVFETVLTTGCHFTLAFEIGYTFLIWRPSLRWVFLGAAVVLHGFIGMFMGLKTFSLVMLVMNMAFLRPDEVRWALSWLNDADQAPRPEPAPRPGLQTAVAAGRKK